MKPITRRITFSDGEVYEDYDGDEPETDEEYFGIDEETEEMDWDEK